MSQERIWTLADLESVHLSPTNRCNFRCIMCPTPRMAATKGILGWKTFEKTLKELRELQKQGGRFHELHFYLEGEPFLHPNYLDMLRCLDRTLYNIKVIISTNGSFLLPEVTDEIFKLRKNQYLCSVSMDASNEELYERIKPGSDYRLLKRNIEYFLSRKNKEHSTNPYFTLQFIVMSINEKDRHDFYWQWESWLGPRVKASYCLYEENFFQDNFAHIYWKRYYARSHPLCEEDSLFSRNYGLEYPSHDYPRLCVWLWKKLVIGWDGDVKVCCFYPESNGLIGNVNETSLKRLFEGGKMREFRRNFLNREAKKVPICCQCPPIAWAFDKGLEENLSLC